MSKQQTQNKLEQLWILKKLVQSGQLKHIGPAKGGEWHVLK